MTAAVGPRILCPRRDESQTAGHSDHAFRPLSLCHMSSVIPAPFLFRYAFPVRRLDNVPRGPRLDLPDECALPHVAALDGAAAFADIRIAWNSRGLALSASVAGKKRKLRCAADQPTESDGLQVWIDTRDTKSIHRASRFCHYLCLLPEGGGRNGREPIAIPLQIPRAREESRLPDPRSIKLARHTQEAGYVLDAWIPADSLHGFDPESSARLGFYYQLHDSELGDQFLSVSLEFPFSYDPSLWSTLQLIDAASADSRG